MQCAHRPADLCCVCAAVSLLRQRALAASPSGHPPVTVFLWLTCALCFFSTTSGELPYDRPALPPECPDLRADACACACRYDLQKGCAKLVPDAGRRTLQLGCRLTPRVCPQASPAPLRAHGHGARDVRASRLRPGPACGLRLGLPSADPVPSCRAATCLRSSKRKVWAWTRRWRRPSTGCLGTT